MEPSTSAMILSVMVGSPSMVHQLVHGAGLVVHGEPVDQRLGRLVHAHDLDLGPVATEFQDRHVERLNRTDVPDMRTADIDHNAFGGFPEVEGIHEILDRSVKELTFDVVSAYAAIGADLGADGKQLRDLAGEEDPRQEHAHQHADGEVVGIDHGHHRREHHDGGGPGMHGEVLDRGPREGADRDHDHDRHQRGHGNNADQIAQAHHQDQEHDPRREG